MKINLRKSAVKDLKKIDRQDKEALHAKIFELANFPNVSNIKKLTNFEPAYRLRAGDSSSASKKKLQIKAEAG
jgi:mRNA interferase RelE/StbE